MWSLEKPVLILRLHHFAFFEKQCNFFHVLYPHVKLMCAKDNFELKTKVNVVLKFKNKHCECIVFFSIHYLLNHLKPESQMGSGFKPLPVSSCVWSVVCSSVYSFPEIIKMETGQKMIYCHIFHLELYFL